jgi:hypothetical protein
MNKILIVATILISFNLLAQMESNQIGWATFYNDASTEFSEQFQTEMANQLMDKFNAIVEIDNLAQNKGFMLFVGMTDLKTTYQNGYAFALVEVIAPNSYSKTITVYWKSDNNQTITKSDTVSSTNVEFGWCSDFEKEFFRSFAKENVVKQIDDVDLNFKFVADFQFFPDLTINYEFKTTPTQEQLKEIKNQSVSKLSQSYISEITEYEGKYFSMIDFQSTEVEAGRKQIEQYILILNSSEVGKIINSITIN